jgi:hypothetical protein
MIHRLLVALTLPLVLLQAAPALAQAKKKTPFNTETVGKAKTAVKESAPPPAFLLTLVEQAKRRVVMMPYRDPTLFPGREPHKASITAARRIQGDDPPKYFVYVFISDGREVSEEDVRKLIQFKRGFDKRKSAAAEVVETARLTLNWHGFNFDFNLKTGECTCDGLHVPDGFFAALSDALDDLEKLKAVKPAFAVK